MASSSSWGQPPETFASISKTQTASLEIYSLLLHDGFILAGIPQGIKRNILFDTYFVQIFPGSLNHAGLKSSHTWLLYHNTDDRGLKQTKGRTGVQPNSSLLKNPRSLNLSLGMTSTSDRVPLLTDSLQVG